ncbi:hypothetical protein ACUY3M_10525 [Corynebacterium suicordis]
MKIYATNIQITFEMNHQHWLAVPDFNQWKKNALSPEYSSNFPLGVTPEGVVISFKTNSEKLVESIDIDIPLPKQHIPFEFRQALYSVGNFAPIQSIAAKESTIHLDEYNLLHGTGIWPQHVYESD